MGWKAQRVRTSAGSSLRPRCQRGALRWPSVWAWAQFVAALLVTAAVAWLWLMRPLSGPVERLDAMVQDAQTRWRGRLEPGKTYPIVLLRIDAASAVPFHGDASARPLLAEAITRLQAAKPRLIAIDLPLFDPKPGQDMALAAAMRAGAPVLLPFALPPEPPEPPASEAGAAAEALRPQAFPRTEGPLATALRRRFAQAPPEPLRSAAASLGHRQTGRSRDGSLRHDLPALALQDAAYPSLALRIAGDAMRQPWSEATLRWRREIRWGSLRVPLDGLSRQGVNDYGPAGTFPSVTLSDLVDGRVPDDVLHNRIVIVGLAPGVTRAAGAAPDDTVATPFDPALSRAEWLATVADNLLTGRTLSRPAWAPLAELGALLALPLLCMLLLARGRWWRGLLGVAVLAGIGLAAAQWLLQEEQLVLSLGGPLLAAAVASASALLLRLLERAARHRREFKRLQANEARHALAAQGANDGLWDWDIGSDRLDVSSRWRALMGEDEREPSAERGMARFTAPLDEAAAGLFRAELDAHLKGQGARFHHVLRFRQGGQPRALLARGMAQRVDGRAVRMGGTLTDLSEQERLQAQLVHDAMHDGTTGLPNRALFLELLAQRLAAPVPGVPIGVALIGLDDFHAFTERHGAATGEAIAAECARRLSGGEGRAARVGRVAARVAPDQFALLFEIRLEAGGVLVDRVPEWALARIEEPFLFDAIEPPGGEAAPSAAAEAAQARRPARTGAHRLTACAGWSHTGQGGFSAEDLLATAASALARAKAAGAGQVRMFDRSMPRAEPDGAWAREHLPRALAAGEFELHYLPVVRLNDRALQGFEALLRWRHPERGLLMPEAFLCAAEAGGQIAAIGRWTLIEAALLLRRWREIGFKGEIAVNLSGAQLARGEELLGDAGEALRALGEVPPSQLRLEVAERVAMAHPRQHAAVLQALARLGFALSIDDVGTGRVPLAELHRFPVDTLKIDRGIVARLGDDADARETVRTIAALARAMGWRALAEGVEDEARAAMLEELGVPLVQGWLFAKALPAEEARRLVQTVPWKKPAA